MSITSMYTAVSGLQAHQQYLDVVANNLANVDTVGFKGSTTSFEDQLSQTLVAPSPPSATNAGSNGEQVGLGVRLGAITTEYTQGAFQATNNPSDVAVEGNGFFTVKDPISGAISYTRAGNFTVDSAGNLVNPNGQHVQGGAPGAVAGAALVDMQIPTTVGGVSVESYNIDPSGKISALLADGTTSVLGNITLQNFQDPQALQKVGNNLYVATPAAGAEFAGYQTPGTNGLGTVRSGYLEQSNVDLGQEFTDMISAERGLQANSKVITTADEVLQELINLKR